MHPRSRRFLVWLAISIAIHLAAAILIPPVKPHETLTTVSSGPLTVELVPQQKTEVATAEQVAPKPQKAEAPPIVHRPIVAPRTIAREGPKAVVPLPPPETPTPQPTPPPKEPPVDMMASIAARRAQREAAEAAMARGPHRPTEAELAQANINRNLQFNQGGVGGVFQILSKGQLTAEFAFNGWEPNRDRSWREVIEVHVKPGEDIERGIVKRMMELIRGHYKEDFRWESQKLGRVVVLSARPEDTEGTEDFLMREFFDTPMARR